MDIVRGWPVAVVLWRPDGEARRKRRQTRRNCEHCSLHYSKFDLCPFSRLFFRSRLYPTQWRAFSCTEERLASVLPLASLHLPLPSSFPQLPLPSSASSLRAPRLPNFHCLLSNVSHYRANHANHPVSPTTKSSSPFARAQALTLLTDRHIANRRPA